MSDNGDPLWSAGMRQVRELSKPHEVRRGFKVFEVISQASKCIMGFKGISQTSEAYVEFGGIS